METYFVKKTWLELRALKLYYISHALKITLRKDISTAVTESYEKQSCNGPSISGIVATSLAMNHFSSDQFLLASFVH